MWSAKQKANSFHYHLCRHRRHGNKFDPTQWNRLNAMDDMWNNVGTIDPMVNRTVNNNTVNVHYDSMFKIEGDVIDADRITKRMETAANKIAHNEVVDYNRALSEGIRSGRSSGGKWDIKY